jgi:hypothetical protein
MKYLKFLIAWFNYYCGEYLTNHRKLEVMGKIYKDEYEQAKKDLRDE